MSVLNGIRVVDLSRLLPGPFCTQLLVDLGAEVVKVEDPNGGDYLRNVPPCLEDGTSVMFHAVNRGKKSVCLDLKLPADHARFLALLRTADVVVESFRPGVMAKLGLAPAVLLAHNPRVVVCSISGYGQTGAYRLKAGHDINYLARAGVLSMMKDPTVLPMQVADLAGGALPAALQVCAALVGRATTGRGCIIDVSMMHASFGLLTPSLVRASALGESIDEGRDMLVGRVPCYGVYATKDGHLAVGALEPKFWLPLCEVLDLPALALRGLDDDDAGEEVRAVLAARFAEKTSAVWQEILAPHDVCVEVLRSPAAALADADLPSVGVEIAGRVVRIPVPSLGIAGAMPSSVRAPGLGEHTDAILGALAGADASH